MTKNATQTIDSKKKNNRKLAVVAAILVFLVALTSVFIGTLAKYITSSTGSDSAVVAEFGLNVPNTVNLFSDSYTNVKANADGKKIIAPGTDGNYQFNVTGKSEVAYTVSADVSVTYSEEWDEYEPLEFSIDGENWTDLAQFETNLSTALASDILAPNATYESNQKIYWRSPFSVSSENDVKDTGMGSDAASGTAADVSIELKVTATQVD